MGKIVVRSSWIHLRRAHNPYFRHIPKNSECKVCGTFFTNMIRTEIIFLNDGKLPLLSSWTRWSVEPRSALQIAFLDSSDAIYVPSSRLGSTSHQPPRSWGKRFPFMRVASFPFKVVTTLGPTIETSNIFDFVTNGQVNNLIAANLLVSNLEHLGVRSDDHGQ